MLQLGHVASNSDLEGDTLHTGADFGTGYTGFSLFNDLVSNFNNGSSILENWFSPGTATQKYNAWQAQLDRDYNSKEASLARDFSASEAQKQRDYEERLSNTAYQRAVSDMRSAGLNPYALYGSSSPASTPQGSSASGSQAHSQGARVSKSSSGVVQLLGTAISLLARSI